MSYEDLFNKLSSFTQARLNLGNSGTGLTTKAMLAFNYDHALAKDAVYTELDCDKIQKDIDSALRMHSILLKSEAENRETYLKRPDYGRKLDDVSKKKLSKEPSEKDIVIIISDGLSAKAVQNHAIPFLKVLLPKLNNLTLGTIMIVENGRVALSDDIGESIKALISINLIGERPGLSTPDSMGIYLTYNPKVGNTDEKRNCISNIHQHGLSYEFAASKLNFLIRESIHLKLSGVHLKDDQSKNSLE